MYIFHSKSRYEAHLTENWILTIIVDITEEIYMNWEIICSYRLKGVVVK